MATTEAENKEKAQQLPKGILEEGNLDLVDEHFADDYVGYNPAVPEPYGRDGFKEFASMFRTAFPDCEVTFEDVIAEGDTVVRRDRLTGTHDDEFMGIEPTENEVEVQGIVIMRFDEDGKVVEERLQADMMGLMQQLGVVEPPDE